MSIKIFFSVALGILVGCLSNLVFTWVVAKSHKPSLLSKLYLAELCKIVVFVVSLLIVFKFLNLFIDPAIFIISNISYFIITFIKNLLKLRV